MLKINNENMDYIVQVEEDSSINRLFRSLTLEMNDIMIICPELFFQRFIQATHEDISHKVLDSVIEASAENRNYISLNLKHKRKEFNFHFIILYSDKIKINNPFKGDQILSIGMKEIKIQ